MCQNMQRIRPNMHKYARKPPNFMHFRPQNTIFHAKRCPTEVLHRCLVCVNRVQHRGNSVQQPRVLPVSQAPY